MEGRRAVVRLTHRTESSGTESGSRFANNKIKNMMDDIRHLTGLVQGTQQYRKISFSRTTLLFIVNCSHGVDDMITMMVMTVEVLMLTGMVISLVFCFISPRSRYTERDGLVITSRRWKRKSIQSEAVGSASAKQLSINKT